MYDSHGNTAAVQATNDDASASKLSCVKKGYMKDDYIPHISVRKTFRRSPFINLRLLCLLAVIWKLLYQFVDVEKKSDEDAPVKKQILSLGAGFYTTYFQLQGLFGDFLVLLITTKLGFLPHEKRGYNSNDTYIYLYYISLAVAVTVNTVQASRWHVPAHWYVVWEKDFLINL